MQQTGCKKIKILYIQAFAGGGSMVALQEMLRLLDKSIIEPVVLCYYKNRYSEKLASVTKCKMIYLFEEGTRDLLQYMPEKKYGRVASILVAQLYSIKKYFFTDKEMIKKIYSTIKTESPGIVHHNNDVRADRHNIRAALKAGVVSVLHNRSMLVYRYNIIDYVLDYLLLRKVSAFINITVSVKKHYRRLFHLSGKNSFVFHDFVNARIYRKQDALKCMRKELGISEEDCVITSIGRLTYWKGQHVLIEAANLIKDKVRHFKVLIVGSAEKGLGSQEYYQQLKEMAAAYHLESHIVFAGNREDIAAIINISDVITHTAVKPEPQGLVIIEALLCEKKLIASNDGGAAELVKKYGGILVKPGDAEELSKVLLQLINRDELATFGAHYAWNYEKLINDFDPENKMQQLLNIYKSVLK